jgi:hypothetical protein
MTRMERVAMMILSDQYFLWVGKANDHDYIVLQRVGWGREQRGKYWHRLGFWVRLRG